MRILLCNTYHDSNKGDAAIVLGTVAAIRKHDQNADIRILSRYSAEDTRIDSAHRHVQAAFRDLTVTANPLPRSSTAPLSLQHFLSCADTMLAPTSGLLAQRAYAAYKPLLQCDALIGIGGHYLFAKTSRCRDLRRLARFCYPHLAAQRAGIRHIFFGHSIGPFVGATSHRLASNLFSSCTTIALRESTSLAHVRQQFPNAPALLSPDCAFGLPRPSVSSIRDICERYSLEPGKFVAVTVRSWGTREDEESYLRHMAEFLSSGLSTATIGHVVVVAQCHGPDFAEDDRPISRRLAAMLDPRLSSVIVDDLSPSELIALFGGACATIGTRFHSVIFSLLSGVPSLAISYFGPKARGVMASLGVEEYSIDHSQVDAESLMKLYRKALEEWDSSRVLRRVDEMRDSLHSLVARILTSQSPVT